MKNQKQERGINLARSGGADHKESCRPTPRSVTKKAMKNYLTLQEKKWQCIEEAPIMTLAEFP